MLAFGLTLEDLSYFLAFQISVFAPEKKFVRALKLIWEPCFRGIFHKKQFAKREFDREVFANGQLTKVTFS